MYQNGACYIRVSTDDQTEYSPSAQLKLLKKYAKDNDIILAKEHIYIDEGISGKRADKRPAFMKMIATAKTKPKPFDVIIVHKFDRFARSREDSVVYKSLLRKECNIKVVSITESIEDDKFSVILEAMLEAMAEYYSLNLAEEVKKGMTEKAERGGYQSTPPFGYSMVNKVLQPLPNEAEIVKLVYEKYASREMNMRQLTSYINGLGFKTHRGNPFEPRTLEYMLHNPVYIGKARWTPSGKTRRDYYNPDTIIRDSEHEPLISVDLWEKAQERNKENKEIYRKRERTSNEKKTWLSGLVRCAHCGKTLVVQGSWLQCNGYVKAACTISAHTAISILENLVLEKLRETYEGKLEIEIVPKSSDSVTKDEYSVLNDGLGRLEQKEERIKLAYQDGIDTLEEYKSNKTRIQQERDYILEQLYALKEQLAKSSDDGETKIEKIASVYDLLTDDSIDIETKYKTAHFLIEEITYSKRDKIMKITYK